MIELSSSEEKSQETILLVEDVKIEEITMSPREGETVPSAPDVVGGLASPQEITQIVAPDHTTKDMINRLAEKLVAFCFEYMEEDMNLGDRNDMNGLNIDHEAFEEELRVRDSKVIR